MSLTCIQDELTSNHKTTRVFHIDCNVVSLQDMLYDVLCKSSIPSSILDLAFSFFLVQIQYFLADDFFLYFEGFQID